ncbi:MAG TPA: DUF5677 domain-containing protein [Thermoleophilaceae bacterium]|nr:DUF5677 domain-containing protein [Thermoleophilaceae bacterium]
MERLTRAIASKYLRWATRATTLWWRLRGRRHLARERASARAFHRILKMRWSAALDRLDLLVIRSRNSGAAFNSRHRPEAATSNDYLFDALTKLHARACRVASEVVVLLRHGYPEGAHARWRTLHEIAVTMFFLKTHGPEVAERYLLHDAVRRYAAAEEYQKHHQALGYEPYSQEELDSGRQVRDALVARFGDAYATQYGWAASVLSSPTFRSIEEAANMQKWRPWFRMASEGQHGGSHGVAFTLGLSAGGDDVLLAGASDAGLADPGTAASISLVQATVALLTSKLSFRGARDAAAIAQAGDEAERTFAIASRVSRSQPRVSHVLPRPLWRRRNVRVSSPR